jgi:hypothetical protein
MFPFVHIPYIFLMPYTYIFTCVCVCVFLCILHPVALYVEHRLEVQVRENALKNRSP